MMRSNGDRTDYMGRTRRLWLLVPVVALVVIALTASSASASSGTLTIRSDTTLTGDHYGSVVIAADDVTLDCAGYRIVGPGQLGDGVTIENHTGVTVRNCTATGFADAGFEIVHANNNTFVNNTASGNVYWGFRTSGNGNRFKGNRALQNGTDSTGVGFWVDQASGNVFTKNTANANGNIGFGGWRAVGNTWACNVADDNIRQDGFSLYDSSGNTLTGNTSNHNGNMGILLAGGGGNVVRNNTANRNLVGIMVRADSLATPLSTGNTIAGNTANNNGYGGFQAWRVHGSTWSRNTANNNVVVGFALYEDCSDNTITRNTARHNGTYDAFEDSTDAGTNTWSNNNFGVTNPPGL